jgi:RNA polymerase sigma-70 factor (ECF subfamily)
VRFRPTRWSLIRRAGNGGASSSRTAFEEIYELYRYPLYAYVHREGFVANAAADLVQEFLTRLSDGPSICRADPAKGNFRSYLLGALKHLLRDEPATITSPAARSGTCTQAGRATTASAEGAAAMTN